MENLQEDLQRGKLPKIFGAAIFSKHEWSGASRNSNVFFLEHQWKSPNGWIGNCRVIGIYSKAYWRQIIKHNKKYKSLILSNKTATRKGKEKYLKCWCQCWCQWKCWCRDTDGEIFKWLPVLILSAIRTMLETDYMQNLVSADNLNGLEKWLSHFQKTTT